MKSFLQKFSSIKEIVEILETDFNIFDDLSLDITILDEDWLKQPQISFKWNQITNNAQHFLASLERNLKEIFAEMYLEYRQIAIDNKEKFTEGSLNNQIEITKDVIILKEKILETQYIINLLTSAKKAVDDRRRALEGLTQLFATNYFTNERDNKILKEIGKTKAEQNHEAALNKSVRMKKILKSRKK